MKFKFRLIFLASLVIFSVLLTYCNTNVTSSSDLTSSLNSQSNSTSGVESKQLIDVTIEKLPARLSYNSPDRIITQGGLLRLYYNDSSIRLIPITDEMIVESKLNTSKIGQTKVILEYAEQGKIFRVDYNIEILPYLVPLSSIKIDLNNVMISQGQTFKLNVLLEPLNAKIDRVVWTSSNPLVAMIDQDGYVSTVNPGKTTISVDVDGRYLSFTTVEVFSKVVEYNNSVVSEDSTEPETDILDLINSGYIPIASANELDMIRLETNGTHVFGLGTEYEEEFTFSSTFSDENNALNRNYILLNNISLESFSNGTGWLPIGNITERFNGIFDGNNKTISKLLIDDVDADYVGLFSAIGTGSEIKNLTISVNQIIGKLNVGALAGLLHTNATIDNVNIIADNSSTSKVRGVTKVGGLVGSHADENSSFNSTPFVYTLGADGEYHYSNELGRILPNTLTAEDWAVINPEFLTQQLDGKYYINITQEYNEIAYFDEVNLLIFEHDADKEIALSSLRSDEDDFNQLVKLISNKANPIISAINSQGNDVTNTLIERDNLWTPYQSEENGYHEFFELNLGDLRKAEYVNLVFSSVRDYLLIHENMFVFEVLVDNNWVNVSELDSSLKSSNIRRPISYPRLNVIDLTNVYNSINRPSELKIKFGFNRVSYDYFGVVTQPVSNDYSILNISPSSVELGYRGFSNYTDSFPYKNFSYGDVKQSTHGYYINQSGYFTKYGDVSPLIQAKDNRFAIIRYGDELKFTFDAPFVNNNKIRSYIVEGSVWYKHADRVTGTTVEPIPFHGMSSYPHNSFSIIDQEYVKKWNTRYYAPSLNTKNTIKNTTTAITVEGRNVVGGLVGHNYIGNIQNSSTYGKVNGITESGAKYSIGGLVGNNDGGNIDSSFATGNIYAPNHDWVGGLIGYSNQYASSLTENNLISNSYFSGLVQGDYYVGGLIGRSVDTNAINSYSTALVYGNEDVGGLIGRASYGNFENVYSTGDINYNYIPIYQYAETYRLGGLFGRVYAVIIEDSHAYNDIYSIGGEKFGGLIGEANAVKLINSYHIGDVFGGQYNVGGLIGLTDNYYDDAFVSIIDNSFSIGLISGGTNVGGLIGRARRINIVDSYSNSAITISANSGVGGGLIGYMYVNGTGEFVNITDSFAYGTIEKEDQAAVIGGLIGVYLFDFETGTPGVSAYDSVFFRRESNINTSLNSVGIVLNQNSVEVTDPPGLLNPSETSFLSTSEFAQIASFSDYNLTNTWELVNGLYPTLRTNPEPIA
jgi:hypothetical protein